MPRVTGILETVLPAPEDIPPRFRVDTPIIVHYSVLAERSERHYPGALEIEITSILNEDHEPEFDEGEEWDIEQYLPNLKEQIIAKESDFINENGP